MDRLVMPMLCRFHRHVDVMVIEVPVLSVACIGVVPCGHAPDMVPFDAEGHDADDTGTIRRGPCDSR